MRVRPIMPERMVAELAEHIEAVPGRWVRVAIDGAEPSGTAELADALVEPMRVRGREVIRVSMTGYLRPASLRLERGRRDPESYYHDWFDLGGLRREVLDPLNVDGTGLVLPALWDAERDRSPRLERVPLAERGIAVVDGPLLLGMGLPFDFTTHLWLPDQALRRLTSEDNQWKLPAFERYRAEVLPERVADYVVRTDRPGRPAVVDSLDD